MFKHDPLQDGQSSLEWIDHGNNDLTIANAARTSFKKWHTELDDSDKGLIRHLAHAKPVPHFMPFCHVQFVYLRELPTWQFIQWLEATQKSQFFRKIIKTYGSSIIFLERGSLFAYAQQRMMPYNPRPVMHALDALDPGKLFERVPGVHGDLSAYVQDEHMLACAIDALTDGVQIGPRVLAEFLTAQHRLIMPLMPVRDQHLTHKVDFVRSTASGRYVPYDNGSYVPTAFHLKPEGSIKQGSAEETSKYSAHYQDMVAIHHEKGRRLYQEMIADGIAPEEARLSLSASTYTTMIETASLAGLARMCRQRLDSHAQRQIRAFAAAYDQNLSQKFPATWQFFKENDYAY